MTRSKLHKGADVDRLWRGVVKTPISDGSWRQRASGHQRSRHILRHPAVKEVVAWQLAEAMKKKKISKNKMATLLKTSRTQVDRLLSAKDDITLSSLQRAAAIVGRRVTIELV